MLQIIIAAGGAYGAPPKPLVSWGVGKLPAQTSPPLSSSATQVQCAPPKRIFWIHPWKSVDLHGRFDSLTTMQTDNLINTTGNTANTDKVWDHKQYTSYTDNTNMTSDDWQQAFIMYDAHTDGQRIS